MQLAKLAGTEGLMQMCSQMREDITFSPYDRETPSTLEAALPAEQDD